MFMQTHILSMCRHESKVIYELVMEVLSKLDHPVPNVKEELVGIDSRVDEVKSLLELGSDDVRFIGIWGMGGIGKTTIANALFDNIGHQFERVIFIHEVPERSKKYSLKNGTQAVEDFQLDLLDPMEVDSSSDALQRMYMPRLVKFRNVYLSQGVEYLSNQFVGFTGMNEYPSKSLPTAFKVANLIRLELHLSQLEQFWREGKL
ncbi:hypothetical protein RJ639_033653 [Escallonia herrerae]|uniref:NB-ARC domain-containing protein n=1 Tax=Escallonia herrerae TaxID=1293975 RepID=A0AA89B9R0_9ASTE|nr:hypothetical protein RJ639_033653 [Escallonia herrerae]